MIFKYVDKASIVCLHYTSHTIMSIVTEVQKIKNKIMTFDEYNALLNMEEEEVSFWRRVTFGNLKPEDEIIGFINNKSRAEYEIYIDKKADKQAFILPRKYNFSLHATKHGHLNLLIWGISQECTVSAEIYDKAEDNYHFNIIMFAHEVLGIPCFDRRKVFSGSFFFGYSPWSMIHPYVIGKRMLFQLIIDDNFDVFKRVIIQGCPYHHIMYSDDNRLYTSDNNIHIKPDWYTWLYHYHREKIHNHVRQTITERVCTRVRIAQEQKELYTKHVLYIQDKKETQSHKLYQYDQQKQQKQSLHASLPYKQDKRPKKNQIKSNCQKRQHYSHRKM